ncbi:MAG: DUF928 domain-containing protein [Acidobacteriia bacterium]|nr:DUF928 domain-containing protein [Terriglobia bacterium]
MKTGLIHLLFAVLSAGFAGAQPQGSVCQCIFVDPPPLKLTVHFSNGHEEEARAKMSVQTGDVLVPSAGFQATLLCESAKGLVREPIRNAGPQPVPCSVPPKPLIQVAGRPADSHRLGPTTNDSITLLAPRGTRVRSTQPRIRWIAIEGATQYTIIVRNEDISWSNTVPAAKGDVMAVTYPSSAPPLKPGGIYKAIVRSGSAASNSSQQPNMGFEILTENDAREVDLESEKLDRLNLPAGDRRFARASLFAAYGLYADAIEELGDGRLVGQDPFVQRFLATVYLEVGLHALGRDLVLKSLKPPASDQDSERGRATSHALLGQLYEWSDAPAAIREWQLARTLYEQLGEAEAVKTIDARLATLTRR